MKHLETAMNKYLRFIIPLYALIYSTCAASYPNLHFHNLNMSHGISDNYVRGISKDAWGMMWFATLNGINSYDGYRFKQYDIHGDLNWNDAIYDIYEDADSNLWVRGGMNSYVYHRRDDFFDADVMYVLQRYGIKEKPARIIVDMDHNLWTWKQRTAHTYDFSRHRLSTISLPQGRRIQDIACRHGKAMLLTDNGEIWRISNNGVLRQCPSTRLTASEDTRIYIDTSDALWVYDLHSPLLMYMDSKTEQWQDMTMLPQLRGKVITAVMDDGDGNMWIGTDNDGIVVMDGQSWSFHDPFALADNHIVCLYKDEDASVIWCGTSKQGVVFANLTQLSVKLLPMPTGEDVSCITEDASGRLWMGFDNQGIGIFDGAAIKRMKAEDGSISTNQVVCTFTDSRGRQWWGSYGGALYYTKGGKTTFIDNPDLHFVISICETPAVKGMGKRLWFATWDYGIISMDDDGQFRSFTMDNTIMNTNNITDLAFDGRQTLFIGTSNGLFSMNIVTGKMRQILKEHVKALYVNKHRSTLWIGLRKGIIPYNLKAAVAGKMLTVNDGLSHNYVWGFCEDRFGNVWVSTSNGVTRISTATGVYHLTPYYSEDGLGNVRFNNHAITCLPDGDIMVGGLGFVARITPQEHYELNVRDFPVRYTGLSVNGERIEVGKANAEGHVLLRENIMQTKKLRLKSTDRNICIEVTSMDYVNQHKLHYVYRLHDDEPWAPISPLSSASGGAVIMFNALKAGHYHLAVKVAEPEGMTENPVTTMDIEVIPPLYASWQACVLYLLLVIGTVVGAFFRYKRKMLQRQVEEQRQERMRQRQEMNEAKLEFFTQVSHEIRTPLSLVITPLQRLMASPLEATAKEKTSDLRLQLELILRNAQTLMQEITKILDVRNLDDILWIKQHTADKKGMYATIPSHDSQTTTEDTAKEAEDLRKTILIVEDTDDFRMFLHSCLIDHYEVLEASNGKEALEIINTHTDDINLILSDIMMPVMNGMELCNRVKNDINLSHIPFIMLTARTSDEQVLNGFKEGADDYITKPFNLDILLLRIQRLLKWTASAGERFRKMDIKPSEITVSNIDHQLISNAIALVEQNMSDPNYTIEQFCDDMAMSRSSLYKKLMAITGMSPIHFVRTIRIKRGRQLLENSGESISQIAYKTGLSPKQFAKYFKEEYGISPSELKR